MAECNVATYQADVHPVRIDVTQSHTPANQRGASGGRWQGGQRKNAHVTMNHLHTHTHTHTHTATTTTKTTTGKNTHVAKQTPLQARGSL
jgi:hypothetical protein